MLEPCNATFLHELAEALSHIGKFDDAEKLFVAGIERSIMNPQSYRRYADWLFRQNDKTRGLQYLAKAISYEHSLNRKVFDGYLVDMITYGLSEEMIGSILPDTVESYIYYGDYLRDVGRFDLAAEFYDKAILNVSTREFARVWYYKRVYGFYMQRGRYDDALRVLKFGMKLIPGDIDLKMLAGNVYKRLGMIDKAEKQYLKILKLDSQNEKAKKYLTQIKSM